jgi:hypothetical protein
MATSPAGKRLRKLINHRPQRNDALFDNWSIVHFTTGVAFGWIMSPFIALLIMVLWEPLEILVLSPILAKFGIVFGYETLRNSLSDIFFDTMGIILGAYILGSLVNPPFFLF